MNTHYTRQRLVGKLVGPIHCDDELGPTLCGIREQLFGAVLFIVGGAGALLGHKAIEYMKQEGVDAWLWVPLKCCHVVSTFLFSVTSAVLALVGCIYVIRRALAMLFPNRRQRLCDEELRQIVEVVRSELHVNPTLLLPPPTY